MTISLFHFAVSWHHLREFRPIRAWRLSRKTDKAMNDGMISEEAAKPVQAGSAHPLFASVCLSGAMHGDL